MINLLSYCLNISVVITASVGPMLSASPQDIGEDFDASVTGEAAKFACTINYLLLFIVPSSKDASTTGMFYYNNTLFMYIGT